MRRIPWIDPLRGLAAGLVLVSHVAYWSGGSSIDGFGRLLARGDCGVAIFFAISAFLLTRPACHGQPVGRHYWRRRAARILPAYMVVLVVVVTTTAMLRPSDVSLRPVLAHLFLVQALTGDSFRGFTQAWSLTTEACFYLLVPFVCRWLTSCHRSERSPLRLLGLVAAGGLVVQALSSSSGRTALGPLSTSVVGHAAWFCTGIVVAWQTTHPRASRVFHLPNPALTLATGAATIYVLAATALAGPIHLERPTLAQAGVKEALYASIAFLLVGAGARARALLGEASQQRMKLAGDLSYGLFLWHVLVLDVLFSVLKLRLFHAPFPLVLIVTALATAALARVTWAFVEAPAIRWAHRGRQR